MAVRLPYAPDTSRAPVIAGYLTSPVGFNCDGVCKSVDVTYKPSWKPPIAAGQGVCSKSQIEAIMVACFDPGGTNAACTAARAANAACDACLITDESAAQRGAIVYSSKWQTSWVNQAGCVANHAGDLSASGCGAKFQEAFWGCGLESCASCDNSEDRAKVFACAQSANTGACKPSFDAAIACWTSSPFPLCAIKGETFGVAARRYGEYFCGTQSDGGTADAGSDGGDPDAGGDGG